MPYIERIRIANHWRAPDMEIDLRREGDRPRHLILTGPNGTGKTTILRHLVGTMQGAAGPYGEPAGRFRIRIAWQDEARLRSDFAEGRFVMAWLPEDRLWRMEAAEGVSEFRIAPTPPTKPVGDLFHQYLVNEFIREALLRGKKPEEADRIAARLAARQDDLRRLFERDGLRLEYDDERWRFTLVEPGYDPIDWDLLAAGHHSALMIMAEIGLRIDAGSAGLSRDDPRLSGVAVIDELALHLHPSLQEKILPFLVERFPRIQFIVATHSPAIISSIDGALVVDLRPNPDGSAREPIPSEELRGIRYGDLMVGHFGIATDYDLDSTEKMKRLHRLWKQPSRTPDEETEMRTLAGELANRSHALALEIAMRSERHDEGDEP